MVESLVFVSYFFFSEKKPDGLCSSYYFPRVQHLTLSYLYYCELILSFSTEAPGMARTTKSHFCSHPELVRYEKNAPLFKVFRLETDADKQDLFQ